MGLPIAPRSFDCIPRSKIVCISDTSGYLLGPSCAGTLRAAAVLVDHRAPSSWPFLTRSSSPLLDGSHVEICEHVLAGGVGVFLDRPLALTVDSGRAWRSSRSALGDDAGRLPLPIRAHLRGSEEMGCQSGRSETSTTSTSAPTAPPSVRPRGTTCAREEAQGRLAGLANSTRHMWPTSRRSCRARPLACRRSIGGSVFLEDVHDEVYANTPLYDTGSPVLSHQLVGRHRGESGRTGRDLGDSRERSLLGPSRVPHVPHGGPPADSGSAPNGTWTRFRSRRSVRYVVRGRGVPRFQLTARRARPARPRRRGYCSRPPMRPMSCSTSSDGTLMPVGRTGLSSPFERGARGGAHPHIDNVLFGDNQFFGINHMSEDEAREQAVRFQDTRRRRCISTAPSTRGSGRSCVQHTERSARSATTCAAGPSGPRLHLLPRASLRAQVQRHGRRAGNDGHAPTVCPAGGARVIAEQDRCRRSIDSVVRLLVDAEMKMFPRPLRRIIFLRTSSSTSSWARLRRRVPDLRRARGGRNTVRCPDSSR